MDTDDKNIRALRAKRGEVEIEKYRKPRVAVRERHVVPRIRNVLRQKYLPPPPPLRRSSVSFATRSSFRERRSIKRTRRFVIADGIQLPAVPRRLKDSRTRRPSAITGNEFEPVKPEQRDNVVE